MTRCYSQSYIEEHSRTQSLVQLLKAFNRMYESGFIPEEWKKVIIVSIAKPGRDRQDPTDYRPISLPSCLCKTYEKAINKD